MNQFFQILKKDHMEVKEMFTQLEGMKERPSTPRDTMFQKLKSELLPHMKAEEIAFYEPLENKKEAREQALEAEEEHHVAEIVLKELEKEQKVDGHWGAKLAVLKELVEHHIQEEEGKVFKSAEKVLKSDDLQNIMKRFEQEKEKAKKRMQQTMQHAA
ncbi:MAG TPA: hemerythrin domain-containing protein [Syntrophorhabdaceae bacterium]|nr:hemerythrin domain-containing protein [Syntrophorhabdaceae bacterium]